MPDVYVRFQTAPVVRVMYGEQHGTRVDIDADGHMIGVAFEKVMSVEINGRPAPIGDPTAVDQINTLRERLADISKRREHEQREQA
jgi:hypothetical protein